MKVETLLVLVVAIVLVAMFSIGIDKLNKAKKTQGGSGKTDDALLTECGLSMNDLKNGRNALVVGLVLSIVLLVVSGALFLHHTDIVTLPGVKKML